MPLFRRYVLHHFHVFTLNTLSSFFLFFILFVYNLLGSVRQLLHSIVLSLSLSFHFYLASQFRAFEIIKARIFQRAVPAKLVFCFDVAIDRTWPRALDNAFCPRRYTQRFNETFYRLTNVLDFFFSFSHFLKPVKGSLSLSLARSLAHALFKYHFSAFQRAEYISRSRMWCDRQSDFAGACDTKIKTQRNFFRFARPISRCDSIKSFNIHRLALKYILSDIPRLPAGINELCVSYEQFNLFEMGERRNDIGR